MVIGDLSWCWRNLYSWYGSARHCWPNYWHIGGGAAAIGGLAGALGGLGIPKNEVLKYETKIQAGEFIILVTGTNEDVAQAKQMLDKISYGVSMLIAA